MEQLEGKFYEYIYRKGQADRDWNSEVLRFYVPHFIQCHNVLDVGCGEGQFIELLHAAGIKSIGVDYDAQMVKCCQEKGLQVIQTDLFDYLPQQKGQFDGIFCSNLIEHFSTQRALLFLQVAIDALCPGGIFLISTPNPESLIVQLYEFWRDATHVRLYSRVLLEFLLLYVGFHDVHSGENPKTVWELPVELQIALQPEGNLSPIESAHLQGIVSKLSRVTVNRPLWRHIVSGLRRRLARFIVETLLFEEFAAIQANLQRISQNQDNLRQDQNSVRTMLQHQAKLLLYTPREIFAKGIKP